MALVWIILVSAVVAAVAVWWWKARRKKLSRSVDPIASEFLAKTRGQWKTLFARLASGSGPQYIQELEKALLAADLGPSMSSRIIGKILDSSASDPAALREIIRQELTQVLAGKDRQLSLQGSPAVVVVVGVNGSGKTTTIAKLCTSFTKQGKRCLIAAADTFRAAADTQLGIWAERLEVEVVSGSQGADPASVAYDALAAGRARGADVVLVDTAGRLQEKQNLMEQLAKVLRVLGRDGQLVSEVLLVMDATTGQNGLQQARIFAEHAGVTGIVLTKLDGSAKGGVVVAIEQEFSIPVKLLGWGESMEDLTPFDCQSFVEGLLAESK